MQLPPLGLTAWVLVYRMVTDTESRHRSVNSAQTSEHSLVISEPESTDSRPNVLGAIYGHCERGKVAPNGPASR
jgi:hypothetical protein